MHRSPWATAFGVAALLGCLVLAVGCSGRGGDDDDDAAATTATTETPSAAGSDHVLIAFAPNPEQPGAEAKAVRLTDVASGEHRDIGEPGLFDDIAFSPDGEYLAAANTDGDVTVYRVADGSMVASDTGGEVTDLSWAPTGTLLAVVRAEAVTFLDAAGTPSVEGDFGASKGANPLTWAWSPDAAVFAMVTPDELILNPLTPGEEQVRVYTSDFPATADQWAVRTGESGREIGLDDLAPVSGLPEGRAEYPVTLQPDGSLDGGEFRYVSIYDWNTLPSEEFDYATTVQFPAVRKTCDPCRSADGAASLLLIWTAGSGPTPTADVTDWPEKTKTILAIEGDEEQATALDMGITPEGTIDIGTWAPVYDAVRLAS